MKKLLISLVLMYLVSAMSARCYSIRCEKCLEGIRRHEGNSLGIAVRQWGEPTVHKDGHVYGWYRCSFGHHYLVDLGPEE